MKANTVPRRIVLTANMLFPWSMLVPAEELNCEPYLFPTLVVHDSRSPHVADIASVELAIVEKSLFTKSADLCLRWW